MVNNPSIILADEPTGNLDTKNVCGYHVSFEEVYAKGNTIIVVTHKKTSHVKHGGLFACANGLLKATK
jgi:putative ABC transport system ATP-binding protein